MRILVVDNNVELCQALQDYFDAQHDLEVVGVAYDGEQALNQIQSLKPDVVLLDITMPYLDGLGVMERLQSLAMEKTPKIFVMTAFGTDRILSHLMALGADYFIVKPFKLDILAQRLREFGERSAAIIAVEGAATLELAISQEQRITKLLHDMGIPPHYKGFAYLKEAVLMCIEEGYFTGALSKEIYPYLAEKYQTTTSGVEAAIRNSIVTAWEHGNTSFIRDLCQPYCDDKMPTNSLIIAKVFEESYGA